MTKRLDILLLTYEFPPHTATGGIGSYMLHLARLLNVNGHKVTVFSALPGGVTVEHNSIDGYEHYCIPANNNEEFRNNAAVFFETYSKDHIVDVMESPEVGACAIEIKRKFPAIPLVVKMHTPGVLINKISRYYQPLSQKLRYVAGALLEGRIDSGYWGKKDKNQWKDDEYLICTLADTILSPSVALKKWAVAFWGLPENRIQVVPNPFSRLEDLFNLPVSNRPKQISFVGKLTVLKGMFALTKAIPVILNQNKDYRIFLVGRDETEDGRSMKAMMQQKLAAYADRIIFTGALPASELKDIYAKSRVCVFPSLWENYPAVILEAMAAGATVAASNCGGIPEMITDKKTGLLFNPLKPKQIAEAVNGLLHNDAVREQIATDARKALQDQLKRKDFEEKILSVYLLN